MKYLNTHDIRRVGFLSAYQWMLHADEIKHRKKSCVSVNHMKLLKYIYKKIPLLVAIFENSLCESLNIFYNYLSDIFKLISNKTALNRRYSDESCEGTVFRKTIIRFATAEVDKATLHQDRVHCSCARKRQSLN